MPASRPPSSRQYRAAMWLMVVLAALALVPTVAGARGVVPRAVGAASGALAFAALVLAGLLGLKGVRLAAAARDEAAEQAAMVILAAMLKDKTREELEPLARLKGAAGQAARMILDR
ncbi:MAG: hypothetical protein WBC97_05225 [Gemmatimonadales bacterium]